MGVVIIRPHRDISDLDRAASAEDARHDHLLQMVGRRKKLILGTLAVCMATAGVYLGLAKPVYTSSSDIYYQQNAPRLMPDGPTPTPQAGVTDKFLATEAKVVGSSAVLAVALDKMEEAGLALFEQGDPLQILQAGLSVELGRKDDILTVSFNAHDPAEAQTVVRSIVDAYQTFQKDKRQHALDGLSEQRSKILTELREKGDELTAFKQKHGTLSFEDDKNNAIMHRLASLSDAVTAAHLDAITAKNAYEEAATILSNDPEMMKRVEAMREAGMSVSVADQATLRMELFNLQQRMADARRQYMAGHPIIQTIQGRIDELSVAYVAAARERWLASERRLADLERSQDDQQKLALTMQARRQEYNQLADELKDLQQLAADMANQHNRLMVLESVGQLNITVLEPATLAAAPSSPNKTRTLIIALAAGVLGGLGLALLVERRDQTLRNADEVKLAIGVPVLGVVPAMRRDLSQAVRGMKVHVDPASDIAEAYRTVRTAVYFGLPDDHSKTILITSPSAGDGKSTLVSNLAIAMAQAGRRVLIIDADLRLPTQHKIFDVEPGAGLSTVLRGDMPPESAVVATGIDNLDLLPCGPIPGNPSEILNSQGFSDLLGDLATQYDHIVLDSPALMGVADARIAAAWCDATVLVLHAEKTDRKLAELARDGLVAVGANLVGVVVNDVDRNSPRNGFFADFGYGPESRRTAETPPGVAPAGVATHAAISTPVEREPLESAFAISKPPARPEPATERHAFDEQPPEQSHADVPPMAGPIEPPVASADVEEPGDETATQPEAPKPPAPEPTINDKLAETSAKLRQRFEALRSARER